MGVTYDIIIPNYVTPDLAPMILECLQSIRTHSSDYRLIVIDNGSPAFDLISVELALHLNRVVIAVPENLGFVKAVNLGMKLSIAPYVVILNNDTRLVAGWLGTLRAALVGAVGLSGPRTNENGTVSGNRSHRSTVLLAPGEMLVFFCVMIKREVIDKIGLLDEKFGLGLGDDDDYSHRAQAAGFRLAFVGNLEIYHKHKATFKALYSVQQIRNMGEHARELIDKSKVNGGTAKHNGDQLTRAQGNGKRLDSRVEVFTRMLQSCEQAGHESRSGSGSSLHSTAVVRKELSRLLAELGVQSLLDAACGDFNWMRHVVNPQLQEYIGIDVLPDLIQHNQEAFGGPNRKFLSLDFTYDQLFKVDLIFCRDCLVHLSFTDVADAVRNFRRSQSRFLLTTSFPNHVENEDIPTGDWRPLNLQRSPFYFPPPMRIINENCEENGGAYRDKSLALWEVDRLPY
jgi:GT2 family glycosyltransferase